MALQPYIALDCDPSFDRQLSDIAARPVACLENEPLALFILEKRDAIVAKDGYKEKLDTTLTKAHRNVCDWKHPICSLRDASKIHGIGNWMLKLLKGFFPEDNGADCEPSDDAREATKGKAKKRYIPQKSSAPYAILLTLYRALQEGHEFMKKQELIDAAEASGLSRMPIQPSRCSGSSGQFGRSTKDWYYGWNSMKTLLTKGLVVRSSCPAKYMLTEEGKSTAEECLQRSGTLTDSAKPGPTEGMKKSSYEEPSECLWRSGTLIDAAKPCLPSERMKKCSYEDISANIQHGTYSTFAKHSGSIENFLAVDGLKQVNARISSVLDPCKSLHMQDIADVSSDSGEAGHVGRLTSSEEYASNKMQDPIWSPPRTGTDTDLKSALLHLPPLKAGERFADAYDVIIVLDDRERYMNIGSGHARDKFADQLRSQFQVQVEVRHLPIGDTLWLARHRNSQEEYVLDFIVERKQVSDLLHSIRDTRYKQQKRRLLRCGLRKLIYVVEGDPNVMDSAESVKTACFTTEIAEGFDVQRTRDTVDTMRKYGQLTQAITLYYSELSSCQKSKQVPCMTYQRFLDYCKGLEKEKVSDVFGVMLMQVKHVTENIALSILEKYPTPLSLVLAYSKLEGNLKAQEQLLKGMPILNENKEISSVVSKRVFQFVCSPELQ